MGAEQQMGLVAGQKKLTDFLWPKDCTNCLELQKDKPYLKQGYNRTVMPSIAEPHLLKLTPETLEELEIQAISSHCIKRTGGHKTCTIQCC